MSEVNKHFDVTTAEELREVIVSHIGCDMQGIFVSAPMAVIQDFMNDQGRRIRAQIASWKDHSGITQINLPTDEQVQTAWQILRDHGKAEDASTELIDAVLLILLNKDRILGYR